MACKVCKLEPALRLEVDRLLIGDPGRPNAKPVVLPTPPMTARAMSVWLKKEHGFSVSFSLVNNHRLKHLRVGEKAAVIRATKTLLGPDVKVDPARLAKVITTIAPDAAADLAVAVASDSSAIDAYTYELVRTARVIGQDVRARIRARRRAVAEAANPRDPAAQPSQVVAKGGKGADLWGMTLAEAQFLTAGGSAVAALSKARKLMLTSGKPEALGEGGLKGLFKTIGAPVLPIPGDEPDTEAELADVEGEWEGSDDAEEAEDREDAEEQAATGLPIPIAEVEQLSKLEEEMRSAGAGEIDLGEAESREVLEPPASSPLGAQSTEPLPKPVRGAGTGGFLWDPGTTGRRRTG
jgi:hypothetical protein